MKNNKPDFLDWININKVVDFSKAQWLGNIVGVLLLIFALLLVIIGLIALFYLFGALVGVGPFANDTTAAAVRNIGLLLFAMFGAPFLVWRSVVAQKQVDVTEQAQITDRINKCPTRN